MPPESIFESVWVSISNAPLALAVLFVSAVEIGQEGQVSCKKHGHHFVTKATPLHGSGNFGAEPKPPCVVSKLESR